MKDDCAALLARPRVVLRTLFAVLASALLLATVARAQEADLILTQLVSANTVPAGTQASFTLIASNAGPADASSVVLSNFLSAKSLFISATASQGACIHDNGIVRCALGILPAGMVASVNLTVQTASGTNSNLATVSAAVPDPQPGDNTVFAASVGTVTLPEYFNSDTIEFEELDGGVGSFYPSQISVSGLTSAVYKVVVTLRTLTHSFPDDLDIVLAGPGATNVILMSDCGLDNPIDGLDVTFDDDALEFLPDADPPILAAPYRPANYGSLDFPPPPAPSRPFGTKLSVFGGVNPNGLWSLFAVDDLPENGGLIADGWGMTIVLGEPLADLRVTQTGSPASLNAGSNLTYTITVTNRGPADARAVLEDPLPAGVTFVSANASRGSCTNLNGRITCNLGNLLNGQGATMTIVVVPATAGQFVNAVNVAGNQLDLVPSNNTALVQTTVIGIVDLAVSGSVTPNPFIVQQPATWLLAVTNRGSSGATSIRLTNELPGSITFISATPGQGICENLGNVVTCQLGALAPGMGTQILITGLPGVPGAITNKVSLAGVEQDGIPANNRAEIITTVSTGADLGLAPVSLNPPVPLDQTWTFALLVTNRGPNDSSATVTQSFLSNVVFLSASTTRGSCTNLGTNLVCQLGNLATGESGLITILGRPTRLGTVTTLATVVGSIGDTVNSNNSVTLTTTVVPAADLELRMTDAPDPLWLGDTLQYTLTVTNHGPNAATSTTLTNVLPPGVSFVSVTSSQGSCTHQSGVVSCDLSVVRVGSLVSVNVVTLPLAEGLITNRAEVSSVLADVRLGNNTALEVTRVIRPSGVFSNLVPTTIPGSGIGSPFPSTLVVSGLSASISRLRVTLTNLTHSRPADLDVLLVGPGGQRVMLMSDVGDDSGINGATLIFDEAASPTLPENGPLSSGLFRPTDAGLESDSFPAPAPAGPFGTDLAVFSETNPTGVWSLFIVDDTGNNEGSLGGWSLSLFTLDRFADLLVAPSVAANPIAIGSDIFLTYNITNLGPNAANNVRLTNNTPLVSSFKILSASSSQGSCTNVAGQLQCDLGNLEVGASATVSLLAISSVAQSIAYSVGVSATETDVVPADNLGSLLLEVEAPPTILSNPISQTVNNGMDVTLTALVAGSEPLALQWQRNGDDLPDATNTTLTLPNIATTQSGNYRLRAQNRVGTIFSEEAMLLVLSPPRLSAIPNLTIDENTVTSFLPFTVSDTETPAEEITLFGTSSDTTVVLPSAITFAGSGSERTVRVAPESNRYGPVTISVTARDSDGEQSTTSFQLLVSHQNQRPSLGDIANRSTAEDAPLTVEFVAFDVETPPENLACVATSSNPGLIPPSAVVFGENGSNRFATITPAPNQFGVASVTVTVTDNEGVSTNKTFQLTVTSLNDAPTLNAISDLTVAEDSGPQSVALTGIATGATNELQNLLVSVTSSALGIIPTPSVTYTNGNNFGALTLAPLTNASGQAVITVTVRDGQAVNGTFSRTFVVTVTPSNDRPTLSSIPAMSIEEDTTLSLPVALADADRSVSNLTLTALSSSPALLPASRMTFSGNGALRTLTLTPGTNQTGTATVFITVTDPLGATNLTSFPLTIRSINDPPTIDAITNMNLPRNAGLQTVPLRGLGSGAFNETDPLVITATSSNPSLIPVPTISYFSPNATGNLLFAPTTNNSGTAILTVTVNDQRASNNLASRTFLVSVASGNDLPTIATIANRSTIEDTPINIPFIIGADTTPAALLKVSGSSSNPSLVANSNIVFSGSGTNRTALVIPSPDQFGTATLTFTVTNSAGSANATFLLTVTATNDAPTLAPIANYLTNSIGGNPSFVIPIGGITAGATNENQTLSVTVTASSTALRNPQFSYKSPEPTGTITLRPSSQTGTTTITVTVTDNGTPPRSFSRSFIASVKPANNILPTLAGITNVVLNENTSSGPIPFIVRDAETPAANLGVTVVSSNPTLLSTNNIALGGGGTNRTITLIPALNQFGTANVTLTVMDGGFGGSNRTFTVTVNPVNSIPTVTSIAAQSTSEDTPSAPIPFTVDDVETPAGSLVVTATSSDVTVVPLSGIAFGGSGPNRALVITPATNQSGSSSITVQVSDGIATNSTSFILTVNTSNDPPALTGIPNQTTTPGTSVGPLPFIVSDDETAAAALNLSADSSNPTLVPSGNIAFGGSGADRTLTVTSVPGLTGTAIISITLTDASSAVATTSFQLTVNPMNRLPTLDAIPNVFINESSGPQVLTLTGIGPGLGESNQMVAVSVDSLHSNLIAQLTVTYSSPASNATLRFVPVPFASGIATISVMISDGQAQNNLTTRVFAVSFNAAPSVSIPTEVTTLEDVIPAIPFTVTDPESPASAVGVTAVSSNPALIPNATLQISGTGSNRTLSFLPTTNQSGVALLTLTATETNGNARSTSFYVTVLPVIDPIVITTQPQNSSVAPGASATFAVIATSTLRPFTFQWQRNGIPLPSATNSTLLIPNVQPQLDGAYAVILSNADGSATSSVATLTTIRPTIVQITRSEPVVQIGFTTLNGFTYTVEYMDVLSGGTWTSLPEVPGTGSVVIVNDPSASASERFYRVRAN